MENIARFALIQRRAGAKSYLASVRWRRVLLEVGVLAAYALCTSLIGHG